MSLTHQQRCRASGAALIAFGVGCQGHVGHHDYRSAAADVGVPLFECEGRSFGEHSDDSGLQVKVVNGGALGAPPLLDSRRRSTKIELWLAAERSRGLGEEQIATEAQHELEARSNAADELDAYLGQVRVSIVARSVPLWILAERLSRETRVPFTVDDEVAGIRVSMFAPDISFDAMMRALGRWGAMTVVEGDGVWLTETYYPGENVCIERGMKEPVSILIPVNNVAKAVSAASAFCAATESHRVRVQVFPSQVHVFGREGDLELIRTYLEVMGASGTSEGSGPP